MEKLPSVITCGVREVGRGTYIHHFASFALERKQQESITQLVLPWCLFLIKILCMLMIIFWAIYCCIFLGVSVFVCFVLILVGFRSLAISGVFCVLVVALGQHDCS